MQWLSDDGAEGREMAEGLRESVRLTISKREAKVRRASFEILSLVKDFRAQRTGGFMTGLVLWET